MTEADIPLRDQIARTIAESLQAAQPKDLKSALDLGMFLADDIVAAGFVTPTPPAAFSMERVEASMRWLVDEGHMTQVAVRQLRAVLEAERSGGSLPVNEEPE
jgi:di/tricarboxylate transporter